MGNQSSSGRLPWYSLVTAAIVIIGFFWLAYYMATLAASLGREDQYRWDRLLFVFNAVQTLTVAAAGVLLGSSVQQARVASAESRADAAGATSQQLQAEAVKAQLARNLVNSVNPPGGERQVESVIAQLKEILD
ncbi:hypothetical protein [Pseudoxanthomonas mexicana]